MDNYKQTFEAGIDAIMAKLASKDISAPGPTPKPGTTPYSVPAPVYNPGPGLPATGFGGSPRLTPTPAPAMSKPKAQPGFTANGFTG